MFNWVMNTPVYQLMYKTTPHRYIQAHTNVETHHTTYSSLSYRQFFQKRNNFSTSKILEKVCLNLMRQQRLIMPQNASNIIDGSICKNS